MKEPTPELIAEINALQSMCTEEIRKRYAALLGVDLERCMNCIMLCMMLVLLGLYAKVVGIKTVYRARRAEGQCVSCTLRSKSQSSVALSCRVAIW